MSQHSLEVNISWVNLLLHCDFTMSESQSFAMTAVQPPRALSSELVLNVQKDFPISATEPASKLQNAASEEFCFVSVFVICKD